MIERIIDNLSMKYDFLYILKNKLIFSILLSVLIIGSFLIIEANYKVDGGIDAIVKNILPFFVDISVIVLFTIALLAYRIIFNDEMTRIVESEKNLTVKKLLTTPLLYKGDNITFAFKDEDKYFYKFPPTLETILNWTNFSKDDFFRVHAGSLDIPKLTILSVETSDDKIHITLGTAAFYDIFFTHYFPDYSFTRESNRDHEKEKSLRTLFSKHLDTYYDSQNNLSFKQFPHLLPNPLGITGIIELKCKYQKFYILKRRAKKNAAAKSKWQWSFAGTLDVAPNFLDKKIHFEDIVHDELDDEVLAYKEFEFLKDIPHEYVFLGIVINHLYLYQPEMFVKVSYTLNDEQEQNLLKLKNEFDQKMIDFTNKKGFKFRRHHVSEPNFLIKNLSSIQQSLVNKEMSFRNLCQSGYDLLENS